MKLLNTTAATFAALSSEAPGQLKGDFTTLASFYQATSAKAAAGHATLADVNPAGHPAMAAASHRILRYAATHCG